jgi:hypothetical protein
MSEDSRAIADGPQSGSSEDPKAIDQALLLALSHRPHSRTPLSADGERLLDGWVADRLPSSNAILAANLTGQNEFAAERVLERRLVTLAEEGPAIPTGLTDRVLNMSRTSQRRRGRGIRLLWPAFGIRRVQIFGAAIAASLAFLALSAPFWHQSLPTAGQIQIALVSVGDRNVLSSPQFNTPLSASTPTRSGPDAMQFDGIGTRNLRLRSNNELSSTLLDSPNTTKEIARQSGRVEQRIRDVEVPTELLRFAVSSASRDANAVVTDPQLLAILTPGVNSQRGIRLLIDLAVVDSLKASSGRTSLPVRLYDLEDEHTSLILDKLSGVSTIRHRILLTLVQ